jgi:hypothetical protein
MGRLHDGFSAHAPRSRPYRDKPVIAGTEPQKDEAMLRKLSAALIAASILVAPAFAAEPAKAPAAPATAQDNTGTVPGKTARHSGYKHTRHADTHRYHRHAHRHGKPVKHVAHVKHTKRVAKAHETPVTTKSAVKAATPATPNRTN